MSSTLAIVSSGLQDNSNNYLIEATSRLLPHELLGIVVSYLPANDLTSLKVHGFVTRQMIDDAILAGLQQYKRASLQQYKRKNEETQSLYEALKEKVSHLTLIPYEAPNLRRWPGLTGRNPVIIDNLTQSILDYPQSQLAFISFGPNGELNLIFGVNKQFQGDNKLLKYGMIGVFIKDANWNYIASTEPGKVEICLNYDTGIRIEHEDIIHNATSEKPSVDILQESETLNPFIQLKIEENCFYVFLQNCLQFFYDLINAILIYCWFGVRVEIKFGS